MCALARVGGKVGVGSCGCVWGPCSTAKLGTQLVCVQWCSNTSWIPANSQRRLSCLYIYHLYNQLIQVKVAVLFPRSDACTKFKHLTFRLCANPSDKWWNWWTMTKDMNTEVCVGMNQLNPLISIPVRLQLLMCSELDLIFNQAWWIWKKKGYLCLSLQLPHTFMLHDMHAVWTCNTWPRPPEITPSPRQKMEQLPLQVEHIVTIWRKLIDWMRHDTDLSIKPGHFPQGP